MHTLLYNLLGKRNLQVKDLDPQEKQQFERWNSVLEEEVTVEKVEEFCRIQIERIEAQWENLDSSKLKNERLIIMHTVYGKILRMLKAKKAERRSVEEELVRLLDSTGESTL